jgi:ribosomal protein S18 acetylase RimI-like enzyme
MYVRSAWRGKSAGDSLVTAVIAHAAGEVEQLVLTVNAENGPAIALYERHGFAVCGRMPRSIKVVDRYYDEFEMILFLTR